MTADELAGIEQGLHWHKPAARERLTQLIAALREMTQEREALRARVAELEQALRLKQIDLHCVTSANQQFQGRIAELEQESGEENERWVECVQRIQAELAAALATVARLSGCHYAGPPVDPAVIQRLRLDKR